MLKHFRRDGGQAQALQVELLQIGEGALLEGFQRQLPAGRHGAAGKERNSKLPSLFDR